jgi:hypothetical protein
MRILLSLLAASMLHAHPGSGIVVDRDGTIYITDTGSGIWKIDRQGNPSKIHGSLFHWMAMDPTGGYAKADLSILRTPQAEFERPTAAGASPVLVTSSDYPVTFDSKGRLYWAPYRKDAPLAVMRASAGQAPSQFTTVNGSADGGALGWLNGIATGAGDTILFTENNAVRRIDATGKIADIAKNIRIDGCSATTVHETPPPMLRGLAVARDGGIYVAATGCRAVVRIAPGGDVSVVLRAEAPWAPTGVAWREGKLHVLEYDHSPELQHRQWPPRVRVGPTGNATTLITFPRDRSRLP